MSSKPTFPQMQHFFALVAEGKITIDNFQTFLRNPNGFVKDEWYTVPVDYSRTLEQMIVPGRYGVIDSDITSENFPLHPGAAIISPEGKPDPLFVDVKLVRINREVSTIEADAYLSSLGLLPARIEHLLAFGEKFPDLQRDFTIAATGSVHVRRDGASFVPFLSCVGVRTLGLKVYGSAWERYSCRFLAIAKYRKVR